MRWLAVPVAFLVACGGPLLSRVPQPDPVVVAAAAAATATALTIADPNAQAKKQEEKKEGDQSPPNRAASDESVPVDVLDRLDAQKAHDTGSGAGSGAAKPR